MPVGSVEREVAGRDRAPQQRGVHDVGQQPGLAQLHPAGDGLVAALVGEGYVDPAGEEVLGVPVALAVPEQDQRVRHEPEGDADGDPVPWAPWEATEFGVGSGCGVSEA